MEEKNEDMAEMETQLHLHRKRDPRDAMTRLVKSLKSQLAEKDRQMKKMQVCFPLPLLYHSYAPTLPSPRRLQDAIVHLRKDLVRYSESAAQRKTALSRYVLLSYEENRDKK